MNPTALVQEIVAKVHHLPPLAPTLLAALRLLDNPDSDAREVAEAILADQVMTAQLLRFANSARYGAGTRITTVSDAVARLGFRATRSLLMAAMLQPMLSSDLPGYEVRDGGLWRHASAVAMCSQALAQRLNYRPAEEAFVAGLIHDIGKVVLGHAMGERFRLVLGRVMAGEVDFLQAERQEFGLGHDDVGALIARKWGLPSSLQETISLHHRWKPDAEHAALVAIVHVADTVCLMLGVGLGRDGLFYRVDERALASLGLQEEDIEQLMLTVASLPPDMNPRP